MKSVVIVVRDPVSVNRAYKRSGRRRDGQFVAGTGMYLTPEGREFKLRLRAAAIAARASSDWPADPYRVAHARLSYQVYDYRGDTDGPRKLIRDALEGILYQNDRVVEDGPAPLAVRDGCGRRVMVTVDLLEERDATEAVRLRVLDERRTLKRLTRIARMLGITPAKEL